MTPAPDFAAEHGPGGYLSASRVACLLLPPEQRPSWMPSPTALAAHLIGTVPLEDAGDNSAVRRGRRLEGAALDMIEEDGLARIVERQPRYQHPRLRMIATPDALGEFEVGRRVVEAKVLWHRDHEERWSYGAPLHYRIQVQAQLACSGEGCGVIVPALVRPYGYDLGVPIEEPRHDGLIRLLEERAEAFLELVERGEMPEPDASESTYRVLQRIIDLRPKTTMHLDGSVAASLVEMWRDAQEQRKAASAAEDYCKRRLAALAGDATEITVDGDAKVTRSLVKRAEHVVKESQFWKWTIK